MIHRPKKLLLQYCRQDILSLTLPEPAAVKQFVICLLYPARDRRPLHALCKLGLVPVPDVRFDFLR